MAHSEHVVDTFVRWMICVAPELVRLFFFGFNGHAIHNTLPTDDIVNVAFTRSLELSVDFSLMLSNRFSRCLILFPLLYSLLIQLKKKHIFWHHPLERTASDKGTTLFLGFELWNLKLSRARLTFSSSFFGKLLLASVQTFTFVGWTVRQRLRRAFKQCH